MISIIIPFFNEQENLPILTKQLLKTCNQLNQDYEIIFVNDGSTDSSLIKIKDLIPQLTAIMKKAKIRVVSYQKKLGKGKALATGMANSQGEIIIFMDGDLQDDPADLPKFLDKIKQGFDFVNGIRIKREDNLIVKIYSVLARYFLKIFLHSPFTDINCGFKACKRNVLTGLSIYGNNFRFLPLAAYYSGYKITEIPVNNRPRKYGQSKFGPGKLLIGILDTLSAYFLYRFSENPLHFFGTIGGGLFFFGFLLSLYLTIERLVFKVLLYRRPALFLGILLIIVGTQIIMTGIIGELIVYLNKKRNQ